MDKNINIKDIAELANVSIASVSRVVNNQPGVNSETRKKITEIIKQTGYQPNLLARELNQQKTNVIGIVLPIMHSYYSARIDAISEICSNNDFGIMIADSRQNIELELKNFNLLVKKRVDGILFIGSEITKAHIKLLNDINKIIPVVIMDQEINEVDIPSVVYDNYSGGQKAVKYLVDQGHKNIGFLGGPFFDYSAKKRYKAFVDTVSTNELPVNENWIKAGNFNIDSGYELMDEILRQGGPLPTAILAVNDDMAIGAIKAVFDRGYSVPEDFSIVGFDDIPLASFLRPALTTIRQDQYNLGRNACELLIKAIKKERIGIKKIILDDEIVERASVRSLL